MAGTLEMARDEAVRTAWQAAVEEILGPEKNVLSAALSSWQGAVAVLRARYGESAGEGIGVRLGRAFARHLIPWFAETASLHRAEFRFLPWPRKVIIGLRRLRECSHRWFATAATLDVLDDEVVWRFGECPFGEAMESGCALWQGFLQEMLYWLSGGKWFAVRLNGEHPLLRLSRHPLY